MDGQSANISWSNFCGWTFQNCSTHNTRLAPPLTTHTPWFDAKKLMKNQQATSSSRNGMGVTYDRGYDPWLSRVQRSLVCCCWRRAILHERSGELSRSVCCSTVVRSGVIVGHIPSLAVSLYASGTEAFP